MYYIIRILKQNINEKICVNLRALVSGVAESVR